MGDQQKQGETNSESVKDGVIDRNKWDTAEYRLLHLLKNPTGPLADKGNSLGDLFVRKITERIGFALAWRTLAIVGQLTGSALTWRDLKKAISTCPRQDVGGCPTGSPERCSPKGMKKCLENELSPAMAEMQSALKATAVINLIKDKRESTVCDKKLRGWVAKDRKDWIGQIRGNQSTKPADIVLCGGHVVTDIAWEVLSEKEIGYPREDAGSTKSKAYKQWGLPWGRFSTGMWYFIDHGTIYLDFPHPSARIRKEYLHAYLTSTVPEIETARTLGKVRKEDHRGNQPL